MDNKNSLDDKIKNIEGLISWSRVIEIVGVIISSFIFLAAFFVNFENNATIFISLLLYAFICLAITQSYALILRNKAYILDSIIKIQNKCD